jgi:hypothetical protein
MEMLFCARYRAATRTSKRKVVEPERWLGAEEIAERVCKVFGCADELHLSFP